jgi:hypothetical protein
VGGALSAKHSAKKTKKQILKSFSVKIIDKQKELVYAAGCREGKAPAAKLTGAQRPERRLPQQNASRVSKQAEKAEQVEKGRPSRWVTESLSRRPSPP